MTPAPALIFETARLRARAFEAGDAGWLAAFGGRAEVAANMMSLSAPWPEEEVRAWLAAGTYRGTIGFRACLVDRTGARVGFVGIGGAPVTVAYAIVPECQGRGYATEALLGLLALSFGQLGVTEVEADHFADNPASGAVLRKAGFSRIGDGMGESRGRLEPAPLSLYRLTRQEYEARR